MILTFTWTVDGSLTNVTTAKLSDPTGTFGVKRTDNDAVVVADGTAMDNPSTGSYQYTVTEPAVGLTYEYWIEIVYGGETTRYEFSITGASAALISTADFKTHARVDITDDDAYIDTIIGAATEWCEIYNGRRFVSRVSADYFDKFPGVIGPRWAPVASVTSITYLDTNGASQTLSPSLYQTDLNHDPARIKPAYNESWPSTRNQFNAVTLNYVAGFATVSLVPERYINAVQMLAAAKYENREAVAPITFTRVPYGVKDLLGIDRILPW